MIALVADNLDAVKALGQRYQVRRLQLFGSAASGAYDARTSDLDFLVDLGEYDVTAVDRFLGLADALEALFERPVDLITVRSVKSPLFRAAIEKDLVTIYESIGSQNAA